MQDMSGAPWAFGHSRMPWAGEEGSYRLGGIGNIWQQGEPEVTW